MPRRTFINGRTVLVTGAGSGLGRRMALEASRRGAHLVLWDLAGAAAEAVRDEIDAHGGTAEAQTVDVSDAEGVRDAAADLRPVDVVINNAGVVSGTPLLETTEAAIRRTMDVNVLALYWVTRAVLPGMLERGHGTVVTISSAAGLVGVARQTDYSASKHAATGFTESLRAELRSQGSAVRTLAVHPYYIDTGMFAGVRTRWPRLLPILGEQDVAETVLDAVEAGRQRVVLPPLVRLVPAARLLPVPVFDRLMDLLGVNRTMDGFTGRAPLTTHD